MIPHLALILCFQLIGEVTVRALGLLFPGPVLGLILLVLVFVLAPKVAEAVRPTANGLLAHLSLLFVPAGVGVIGHLGTFSTHGPALVLALLVSTPLAITVGALTFAGITKLTEQTDE